MKNDILVDAAATATSAPAYKLNGLGAIAIATFIGTSLAGAWLMAENYKALGRRDQLMKVWGLGAGLLLAMLALGFVLPSSILSTVFSVAQMVAMLVLANQGFGTVLAAHGAKGGLVFSLWRGAGIGFLFLLVLTVVVDAFILVTVPLG